MFKRTFTSRDFLLNSPLKAILLPGLPGCVDTGCGGVLEAGLHHLGPVTGTIVASDATGSLGDVNETRTRVLDELVEEELEAELVTGLDGVGGGVASLSALVAAEVVGVDDIGGERGLVRVGVLASVGVVATDGLVVDEEAVEDVVGVGTGGGGQSDESSELHVVDCGRKNECMETNVGLK
jgi:hypothetical protein